MPRFGLAQPVADAITSMPQKAIGVLPEFLQHPLAQMLGIQMEQPQAPAAPAPDPYMEEQTRKANASFQPKRAMPLKR